MCGITGVFGFELNRQNRKSVIKKMTSTLQHRGPDGWGYYVSPDIALGQTRLSIVDLKTGDQPLTSGDLVIVYNGEIFNYIELRAELQSKGIHFITTSDTEVVLKAFEVYGFDCFAKFNGQFAVLIWNKKSKELVIARDRYGIRPLFILETNGSIYFSSEMKAFDQIPGYKRNFNPKHLFEHNLLWNTFADHTVYNDIRTIPGGHFAVYKDTKLITEKSYYQLGQNFREYSENTFQQAVEEFTGLLDDSVKLRLRSDVPVGAYLSGGIDSSVIVNQVKNYTSKRFKTFSVTFSDQEYDESSYQQDMVKQINSDHCAVNITYDDVNETFPEAVYHFERPVFRTAPIPLFLLSQKVQESDIKVVLTGEGADEILWGYDSFKEVKLLEFWSKDPSSAYRPLLIKKLYPHLNHFKDETQYGMMRMFYEEFLGDYNNNLGSLNIRVHNNKILENYFNRDNRVRFDKQLLIDEMQSTFPENFNRWSLLQKNQYLEMKTLLDGYLLSSQGDRMSLAHSIEGRYPFLDHRVVEYAFALKENYKLKGFSQKHLLRKAYENNLPPSIINRPKRPYMSPDLKSFMNGKGPTENTKFFLSDSLVKDYQIFNPKWVTRFLKKFENGIPERLGYRDNMIITFMLSTQISEYWTRNPRTLNLPETLLSVEIDDYKN
ncbi:asparagine synthase (glutamine-hydrolyzing) [Saccharicrinis sp. GN24d3]|uniref:asparagine synthase (glutamine-hydrolyzing) n=1 Tax=Saccharicrinis sp. GN24d3 TaxID=3458416 RepID=UPI004036A5AB